jgi:hypothetical protein
MTEEQLAATAAAREAMAGMREASDALARTLASLLTPAMRDFADALKGANLIINELILGNVSHYDQLLRKLTSTTEDLFLAEKRLGELRERGVGNERARTALANQTAAVAALRKEIDALNAALNAERSSEMARSPGQRAVLGGEIAIPDQTYRPPPFSDRGGGMDPFMFGPEMREKELEEERKFQERRRELLAKAAEDHIKLAQSVVDEERRLRDEALEQERQQTENRMAFERMVLEVKEGASYAAIGFLRALGAEHRGAAIAAIALEKAKAIKEIFMRAAVARAAAAIWLSSPATAPAYGLIVGKITAAARLEAALVAATGLVEAAQVSSSGTGSATLGTSANPLVTSSSPSSAAASARRQTAVQLIFQGDVFGWDEYVQRRVIDGIRRAVDGRDVVLIGGNSRQADLIRGSS